MTQKIRILVLSANPWTTSRILVDEEAREIFERIQEGPYRDAFEIHNHVAVRPIDFQRLLLTYEPQIVHFCGHGSKRHEILFSGSHGRGQAIDQKGLTSVFALYNKHVRLVLLNACFTKTQAHSISEVVDYSIGAARPIGDKASVAFAGAFYRALGFGRSIRDAFKSARAQLALTNMPRARGIELFVRNGIDEADRFPQIETMIGRRRDSLERRYHARFGRLCQVTATPCTLICRRDEMPFNTQHESKEKNMVVKPAHNSLPTAGRKAPGTRVGLFIDWRGGSTKSGVLKDRYGRSVRDGR